MLNDDNRVTNVPRLLQNANRFPEKRSYQRRVFRDSSIRVPFENQSTYPVFTGGGNPLHSYSGDLACDSSGYYYVGQLPNPALYEMEGKRTLVTRVSQKAAGDGPHEHFDKPFGSGGSGEGSSQSYDVDDISKSQGKDSVNSNTSTSGEKSNDAEQMQQFCMRFFDDLRISKLLRRLCGENNATSAIKICEKLEMVIMDAQNAAYIRRAFNFLVDSIISIFEQGPVDCLKEVAKIFGMFGYVVRHDFEIYQNWIFKLYDTRKSIRVHLMRALKTTISMDAESMDLIPFSDRLIASLKDLLEITESTTMFIAISDVIGEFAKNYKKSFKKHFTDIVDILIGWHLETEQSSQLKQHCSVVLQRFSDFFIKDVNFTLGLLGQFLEDIAAFGEDIDALQVDETNSGSGSRKSPNFEQNVPPEISVGSFVGAFNSVLKCLSNKKEIIAFELDKSLLEEAVETIIKVAYKSLKLTSSHDTVQSINEFIILILNCDKNSKVLNTDQVFRIIQLEIQNFYYFDRSQISSLLLFLLTIVKKMQADIPISFIAFLLQPRREDDFYMLKMALEKKHFMGIVKIYHEILSIKNVPLLQEAYKHILADIMTAMRTISYHAAQEKSNEINIDNIKYNTLTQAEMIVNFYLIAISLLATQTSSIIGMYALQPSIVELLIHKMSASDMKLWSVSPTLHDAVIHLLAVHCIKNNNFVSTSNLLTTNFFSKLSMEDSPNSENFTFIIKFFAEILDSEDISTSTALQLLDWLSFLLKQCIPHASVLKHNVYFQNIGKSLCSVSIKSNYSVTIKCAECIGTLMKYSEIAEDTLRCMSEVCYIHISSSDNRIRDIFVKLYGKLPLSEAMRQVYEPSGVARVRESKNEDIQHWYASSSGTTSKLSEKYFKNFIESLSVNNSKAFVDEYLKRIFEKCWTMKTGRPTEFHSAASSNLKCLIFWIQWEAAQYCVNNKLRTTLGKPQDTFLYFEAIIKDAAKILAAKDNSIGKHVDCIVCNQKHTRILLGFLECLEKAIYNASEGTAFGMPAPEKPIKTFFRLNSSTCNEWFNRIRHAIDLLAIHNMEPEMIIRCAELTLRNLIKNGRKNDPMFEQTLITYIRALLKCGESDNLYGLYIWVKHNTGKRLAWIKTAADQASGRREKAADSYLNILSTLSKDEKTENAVLIFIKEQIIDCLQLTGQWNELKLFLEQDNTHNKENKELLQCTVMSLSHINFMMQLEQHHISEQNNQFLSLADWEIFQGTDNVCSNFSYNKTLSIVENTLASMIVKPETFNLDKWKVCESIIKSGLQESVRTKSQDINNMILLNHIAQSIDESNANEEAINLKLLTVDRNYGSIIFTRILRWIDYFNYRSIQNGCTEYNNLRLSLASMARNEGNLKLARRELEKFFRNTKISEITNRNFMKNRGDIDLDKIVELAFENNEHLSNDLWTEDVLHGLYESSKWLFSQTDKQNDAIQLAATSCLMQLAKLNETTSIPNTNMSQRISRTLLKLSDWLSQTNDTILDEEKPIKSLLANIPDVAGHVDEKIVSLIPKLDSALGKLIQYSVKLAPDLSKAWGAMGNWYYRWGRKVVEAKNESDANKAGLGSSDIETIHKFVPNANEDDVEKIVAILNRHQVSPDDEEIGPNDTSSTEIIEGQLRSIEALANVNSLVIQSIVSIWRLAHKNVYIYYEIAADAYFNYLQLESVDTNSNNSASGRDENTDCSVVTATLRLLRLVVKHAFGLQDVLEAGLDKTPTRPWKVIIPQLFSRLNHHEPYVRKRVSELLCRVAKDSPHLIIFPAVVGAAQETKFDDLCEDMEKVNLKEETKSQNTALSYCFNALLDTLSKQAPETVDQVQLLVRELKRVTLLWDELWLHSLAQLYSEYSELFNRIEAEAHSIPDENVNELIEKHRVLMTHVVNDMRRLQKSTSRSPETNFERNFQEKFSKIIEHTIEDLKKPFNRDKPNESWQKIKQLYAIFQQKFQKSSHASLKMADISPILANMQNTAISMPGVETDDNKQIYIKSIDNIVYILQTKTKPKKLAFFGSDGKRYTYLFKGLEDLHLDERIMQFLSIANSMMTKSNDCNGNITTYHAHHYSVIPLGSRSGLISWVDGVAPIFAVYKKWQQREAANPKKDKQTRVIRPSEMFYNKLGPLLAEHNLKTTDNRKQWPLSVLQKVLEELTNDTPRDLLAKELWCCSTNAATWRQAIRNFSLSAAVMSVIGYVIGLGDRHLDNVLVKYTTGDIVHIDYNVCFEKGKTLRVPEKVPFRMTPNIEEALGVTGIEGTFRLTCEHVLKTLRKERETLLTLLEAFVYDPLVDWAVGEDGTTTSSRTTTALAAAADMAAIGAAGGTTATSTGGGTSDANAPPSSSTTTDRKQSRKKIENEAIRDTLASRFAEIKPEWTQYRDDMNEQLIQMTQLLDELDEQRKQMQSDESQRDLLSKQMAMVREVETLGTAMSSHSLSTLSQRYSVYKKAYEEHERIKNVVKQNRLEFETKNELYLQTLKQIGSNQLKDLQEELDKICRKEVDNEFEIVKEFLENSAQTNLYVQADQQRKELDASFLQQSVMIKLGIDTLTQYESVMRYYPRSLHKKHRLVRYSNWLHELENSFDACKKVADEYPNMLAEERKSASEQVIPYSFELNRSCFVADISLSQSYDILQNKFPEVNKQLYQDALEAISLFLSVEQGGVAAMKCVISASLCELNSRYIQFKEGCVESINSPLLYQLTTEWILDEESTYLALVLEHIKVLSHKSDVDDSISSHIDDINNVYAFVQCLRDLKMTFQTDVVPKLFQATLSENENVLLAIEEMSEIQNIFDFDLLMNKLHNNIDCNNELEIVKRMYLECKKRYATQNDAADIFQTIENSFDILSLALEKCQDILMSHLNSNKYENLDHVFASKQIIVNVFSKRSPQNVRQGFEARRLQTILQTLNLVIQMSTSFKDSDKQMLFDSSLVLQPVTSLINDVVQNSLIGLGTHLVSLLEADLIVAGGVEILPIAPIRMDELVLSLLKISQINETFTLETYACAQTMCNNVSAAAKEKAIISNLERLVSMQSENLNMLSSICSVYYWLHEHIIPTNSGNYMVQRQAIFAALKNAVHNLNAWKISIEKIYKELMAFVQLVAQRLKWAAGANQSLIPLQNAFNDLVTIQDNKFKRHCTISSLVLEYSSAILSYESLVPGCSDLIENDEKLLILIEQFEKSYTAHKGTATLVTPVEEGLVRLLDPEGVVDHMWIDNVSGLLDEMTDAIQTNIAELEKKLHTTQDNLQMTAHKLRGLMENELRMDIRYLLKLILKIEGAGSSMRNKHFQTNYKQFLNRISDLHMKVLSKDFTEENLKDIRELIASLQVELEKIYTELLKLISNKNSDDDDSKKDKTDGKDVNSGTPVRDNKKGNQPEQKRNAYAVSVWRRIRMKLEGRDPDPTRRSTIPEQVDWMIREAMNPENLAVLYEGWTPWV